MTMKRLVDLAVTPRAAGHARRRRDDARGRRAPREQVAPPALPARARRARLRRRPCSSSSLINRHYVLDLCPGRASPSGSSRAGHDVYCIDWGTPGRRGPLPDVRRRLRPLPRPRRPKSRHARRARSTSSATAWAARSRRSTRRVRPGALRLAAAARRAGALRTTTGLLGRVDAVASSSTSGAGRGAWATCRGRSCSRASTCCGPRSTCRRRCTCSIARWDDEFLDGFLALETWGNDNVCFPGEVWRTWVEELYRGDAFARGTFALSGKPARLEGIDLPAARRDLRARQHRAEGERRRPLRPGRLARQTRAAPVGRPRGRRRVARRGEEALACAERLLVGSRDARREP